MLNEDSNLVMKAAVWRWNLGKNNTKIYFKHSWWYKGKRGNLSFSIFFNKKYVINKSIKWAQLEAFFFFLKIQSCYDYGNHLHGVSCRPKSDNATPKRFFACWALRVSDRILARLTLQCWRETRFNIVKGQNVQKLYCNCTSLHCSSCM